MKHLAYMVVGMIVVGLAAQAGAQLPLSELYEDFEDDALGSSPSAYAPANYGNDSIVVATGTDGIDSPDESDKYALFVGPRLWSSFWFNDEDVNACEVPAPSTMSADFYIDPDMPTSDRVYMATTFWVNRVYQGEIALGCRLLNDGSGRVEFHVYRFQGSPKGPQMTTVEAGWYHLEMTFADSDEDGKIDVTCIVTDSDGNPVYSWIEPTGFAADDTYLTAGYQVWAGYSTAVPLRVDNLCACVFMTVSVTTKKGYVDLSKTWAKVQIGAANVVSATLGGVDASRLKPKNGGTEGQFLTAGMTDGILVGQLADGTLICGEVPVK